MSNSILLRGLVSVVHDGKVLEGHNHFVDGGLFGLLSVMAHRHVQRPGAPFLGTSSSFWQLPGGQSAASSTWRVFLGTDAGTPTVPGMTGLVSPIGDAPGIVPSTRTLTTKSGADDGVWRVHYHASWEAGELPSVTVGELGLFARLPDRSQFQWTVGTQGYQPDLLMASRRSAAEEDFDPFFINTSVPLTVHWTLEFAFGGSE